MEEFSSVCVILPDDATRWWLLRAPEDVNMRDRRRRPESEISGRVSTRVVMPFECLIRFPSWKILPEEAPREVLGLGLW